MEVASREPISTKTIGVDSLQTGSQIRADQRRDGIKYRLMYHALPAATCWAKDPYSYVMGSDVTAEHVAGALTLMLIGRVGAPYLARALLWAA